ncbi:hypothetical protein BY996DRAFT_7318986 [Phakopsora pachyrhizi]|nr:hypothetical protein BY996DRAFT_7318986 [Phakopsora pachyrhizi]
MVTVGLNCNINSSSNRNDLLKNQINSSDDPIDLLILGAGWTSNFLVPYIDNHTELTYASTTRSGGGKFDSIRFDYRYDPSLRDEPEEMNRQLETFRKLPYAKMVLITFPITEDGGGENLLKLYSQTHRSKNLDVDGKGQRQVVDVIQLGSSGIYDGGPTVSANPDEIKFFSDKDSPYIDRHSRFELTNPRARSESELLSLNESDRFDGMKFRTTVLNLSGLWGDDRNIRNYVSKVAPSKDVLRNKTSVHMIHGLDVSRSIVRVFEKFHLAAGQRWILTDGRVYDWWDLASAWGESGLKDRLSDITLGDQARWVRELMKETSVRTLPRTPNQLGRALDSLEFWSTFGISPVRARLEFPS